MQQNLLKEVDDCGIDTGRIVFGRKMDKTEHLARIRLADLALDTRIVSGAATTSDALRVDVPVITLKGNHFSSRMSTSILQAIGLKGLIATDLEEYEKLAVHLAINREELLRINKRIRKNRKNGPLFDTLRFTRTIEKAYGMMWERFKSGQAPRTLCVT